MNHILKIGLTTLLIITSLLMQSQQTYFNRYWDINGSETKVDCIKYKNHYYVAGNNTFQSANGYTYGMTFEKVDSLGNSIKYIEINDTSFRVLPNTYYSNMLVSSNTGSFYRVGYISSVKNSVTTYSAYLYKTNTNLDSVFFKTYPPDTGNVRVFEAAVYHNNHIYAVGTRTYTGKPYQMMLMKLDTLGNMLWEKTYISPGSGMIGYGITYCIDKTSDGGYALLGQYNKNISQGGTHDLRVVKLDSNFNQQWYKVLYKDPSEMGNNSHSEPCFVLSTSDGNILIGAEMAETLNYMKLNLLKFDLQGNQLWRKKYGYINFNNQTSITDVVEDKKGNYNILMNDHTINTQLLRVSPLGDSIQMTDFGSLENRTFNISGVSRPSFGNCVLSEGDNGFIVFGGNTVFPTIGDNWVSRLDSNGCNMHGTPYNVTANPIQFNGKNAVKIEWQDSVVRPSRKYSIEVRFKTPGSPIDGYYYKANPGLTLGYSYIDTNTYSAFPVLSYRVRAMDSITNNVSCASQHSYITDVSENHFKEIEAKFYPNPAKEFFYVEILNPEKEQITLTIHNLLGEQIKTQQFSAGYLKEQINTKHLSKGIYIVSLQSQSGKFLKQSKIVVQ